MRAIIPAAGKGIRLNSGDALPKVLREIEGRTLLEIVLQDVVGFVKPEDTYIVVGHQKEKVMERIGNAYHYVTQSQQFGTGHAVMMCTDDFASYNGTVLVTFGDMPLFRCDNLEEMCAYHEAKGADCTLLVAENPELKLWARIMRDENGRFVSVVEGKDCTPEQEKIKELFSGVLAFNSRSLFQVLPEISCQNVQHEYYLTEVPELMVKKGMRVETFWTGNGEDLRGVNTREDLAICAETLRKRTSALQYQCPPFC